MNSDALLSSCGTYRYYLHREWEEQKPTLRFIMLNPSTADASRDDPTIRKCVGFAERNGYGAILVMNLFAYRSTDPKGLLTAEDPVGPDNDKMLRTLTMNEQPIVCAWGFPSARKLQQLVEARMKIVQAILGERTVFCVSKTQKTGWPSHPLMVAYSKPIAPWNWP